MKYLVFIIFVFIAVAQSFAAKVDIVITNATIISPQSSNTVNVKTGYWLAIEQGRIVAISQAADKPDADLQIDATGQFLIPGLMDSHTHLKTMPGNNGNAQMQQKFLQRQGINYLYYGVTQLIDPSNTYAGIQNFHASGVTPTAFFCGAMPVYNGYNAQGVEFEHLHEQRPYYVAQDSDPVASSARNHEHQAKTVVKRLKQDGAQCAKVYIEDGFDVRSDVPMIDQNSLRQVTIQARKLKIPTMAHANATDMQSIAVNNGINVMGHGLWNWLDEQQTLQSGPLPKKVQQVLDQIVSKKIAYQPTLNVIRALTDLLVEDHLKLPAYQNVLPRWQIDWYLSAEGQWFAEEMIADWGGLSRQQIIQRFMGKQRNGERVLNYLYKNGATLLLASDTPPAPTYASQPGIATNMELHAMFQAGVDLTTLLAAATINNANAFNLDDDYGTIAVGKVANLLLLKLNPLATIDAYDSIAAVILNGRFLDRAQLHVSALPANTN